MRVLYVGFKGKNNTSYRLVSALNGEKLFLTNSVIGLKKDIESIDSKDSADNRGNICEKYDRVFMFGIDKTLRSSVRMEACAEIAGHQVESMLSLQQLQISLEQSGIACEISKTPTQYLCNAAYYHMLLRSRGRAVFIHIPGVGNMTAEMMIRLERAVGGL